MELPLQAALNSLQPEKNHVFQACPLPIIKQKHVFSAIPVSPVSALCRTAPAIGLSEAFVKLRRQGRAAFIPYLTAGDPNLSITAAAMKILDRSGAAMIELGIPYSDPRGDGPVIKASVSRALAQGVDLEAILSMVKTVVPRLSCPVVLFSYYSPIVEQGVQNFMSAIKSAGILGLVVPDISLEMTYDLRNGAIKNNIELALLTTPTTPAEKMHIIAEATTGFVYLVTSDGVTGIQKTVNPQVEFLIKDIKKVSNKPVAVGFGISKPEHVKKVVQWGADGVIVGSALVKLMAEARSPEEGLRELQRFTKTLTSALQI